MNEWLVGLTCAFLAMTAFLHWDTHRLQGDARPLSVLLMGVTLVMQAAIAFSAAIGGAA